MTGGCCVAAVDILVCNSIENSSKIRRCGGTIVEIVRKGASVTKNTNSHSSIGNLVGGARYELWNFKL